MSPGERPEEEAPFHKSDKPESKQATMSCRIFRTAESQHRPMLQPAMFTEVLLAKWRAEEDEIIGVYTE